MRNTNPWDGPNAPGALASSFEAAAYGAVRTLMATLGGRPDADLLKLLSLLVVRGRSAEEANAHLRQIVRDWKGGHRAGRLPYRRASEGGRR
jgi:hypothetical protein